MVDAKELSMNTQTIDIGEGFDIAVIDAAIEECGEFVVGSGLAIRRANEESDGLIGVYVLSQKIGRGNRSIGATTRGLEDMTNEQINELFKPVSKEAYEAHCA